MFLDAVTLFELVQTLLWEYLYYSPAKQTESFSFSPYIYSMLKAKHPTIGISQTGMSILNSYNCDIRERLAIESSKLARRSFSKALTFREMQIAVSLVLPGELSRSARDEGTKAITTNFTEIGSSSSLQFSSTGISRFLKVGNYAPIIGDCSCIYLAAVLEHITSEILKLACNAAQDDNNTRIMSRHLQLAIRNNRDLNQLYCDVTIFQGGIIPL